MGLKCSYQASVYINQIIDGLVKDTTNTAKNIPFHGIFNMTAHNSSFTAKFPAYFFIVAKEQYSCSADQMQVRNSKHPVTYGNQNTNSAFFLSRDDAVHYLAGMFLVPKLWKCHCICLTPS